LLTALALAFPGLSRAQIAIKGEVRDSITSAPLPGAVVEVRRGGETLGRAVADPPDGRFLVTVDVANRPEAQNLKLLVSRDAYVPGDEDVVVTAARPSKDFTKVLLLRSSVADCMSRARTRWVVVGHFRPPAGGGVTELASRVTDAVRYELVKIAQTTTLSADSRPAVVACDQIDERDFLSDTALALSADALLAGDVSSGANHRFKIRMYLGDQHGLFRDAPPLLSRDVDLDDPSASRLDAATSAAILRAVLTGYHKAGRFEDCVELARRAAAEWRPLPAGISKLQSECAGELAANGLRGGGH
jgi:hypothetical protein